MASKLFSERAPNSEVPPTFEFGAAHTAWFVAPKRVKCTGREHGVSPKASASNPLVECPLLKTVSL